MDTADRIHIKDVTKDDQDWIKHFYQDRWGSVRVVSKGILHDIPSLPGFIAWEYGERFGLLCYQIIGQNFEIVTLDSIVKNLGVGTKLITKAIENARINKCERVWLITTNDNTQALHFYQKRGFHIAAIHINALETSRKIKPEIPPTGIDGIPIRDEIELEFLLNF